MLYHQQCQTLAHNAVNPLKQTKGSTRTVMDQLHRRENTSATPGDIIFSLYPFTACRPSCYFFYALFYRGSLTTSSNTLHCMKSHPTAGRGLPVQAEKAPAQSLLRVVCCILFSSGITPNSLIFSQSSEISAARRYL